MPSIPSPIFKSNIRSISRNPEARIFPVLAELGIGVTAYGVLSRGLLCGSIPSGPGDFRAHFPRFQAANLQHNRRLLETLRSLAAEKGVTAAQLAIAWVLAKGESIVPVVGARTPRQLVESLAALPVALSTTDLARIEAAIPPIRRRRRPLRPAPNANAG